MRIKKIFILFIVSFFVATIASAEEVRNFEQEIVVRSDASLEIEEKINYDFGEMERHGIYRDIIYKYKARGGNYKLRISDISVDNGKGESYQFEVLSEGDKKRIKIGSANKTVTGTKNYVLRYRVDRAVNFFEDHDEIYWNVTGHEWDVPIKQSKTSIIFPDTIAEDSIESDCFTGIFGSDRECVSKRYVYEGAGRVKEIVFIDDILQPGNGFTVLAGLPKGVLEEPSFFSKFFDIAKDNLIILLPFLIFAYLYFRWQKYGRDKGGRGVVVAQFDSPDGLSPMGLGTLYDEQADNKDFSANIISLAVKGYLKIVSVEKGVIFKSKDYALVRLEGREELRKSESMILESIFTNKNIEKRSEKIEEISKLINSDISEMVMMSDLREVFYKDLQKIKKSIYEELYTEGYFVKNPETVRIKYMSVGFVTFILGIYVGAKFFGLIGLVSLVLCSVVIIVFAFLMPKKTEKGAKALELIKGLKLYLEVAEKDRIDFHNAPEKKPKHFERLLPYAMVLGVEKKWADQFKDIYNREPDWYSGGNVNSFTALALANDLSAFRASAASTAASAPSSASSGGSGFSGGGSGGGFGGGGGGSW